MIGGLLNQQVDLVLNLIFVVGHKSSSSLLLGIVTRARRPLRPEFASASSELPESGQTLAENTAPHAARISRVETREPYNSAVANWPDREFGSS